MKKAALYLFAILLLISMVSLGFWQLSRADEKQLIQDNVVAQSSVTFKLNQSMVTESSRYQQAEGLGSYVLEPFLIENQSLHGSPGYHVIAPFQLDEIEQTVLVNLGWVPMGASRSVKPKVVLPEGVIALKGRLQKAHAKPPIWNDETPVIQQGAWQYLDMAKFKEISNITQIALFILCLVIEFRTRRVIKSS